MESLYELWGKRNPQWEKRYQDSILEVFSDYGKGVNKYQDARGKIFGAGYEMFILAFFIGLYYNQTKPLTDDKAKLKTLGQAIMYWVILKPEQVEVHIRAFVITCLLR